MGCYYFTYLPKVLVRDGCIKGDEALGVDDWRH